MVRAALANKRRIGQGPRPAAAYVPAGSVVLGSLLSAMPIISTSGWYPDFGFLVLIAWRLLRADAWPAWWAAPLGFINDLLSGLPIGMSVTLWTAVMIVMDLVDRRTIWRDYWIEWALAAALVIAAETFEWWLAALTGAGFFYGSIVPPVMVSVLAFPIVAWLVSRLDRWRLGR
ncbi:MAG TPA: rod shape-determining protein MreD [Sphingomicrobium sp.]|jgi:rod shape-determining protein MreD|nr:rod shape-determining protein MreD [Sphingomicrobium sp.]